MSSFSFAPACESRSIYDGLRSTYLEQLVAPADDMWTSFADQATPHGLKIGDELVGCASVDELQRMLRFFVLPPFHDRATELLGWCLRELDATTMMVASLDPGWLGSAVDLAGSVRTHTWLYAAQLEPEGPGCEGLAPAERDDHARIVEFQEQTLGAPRAFLEGYVRERLQRDELWVLERDGRIACTGELRVDPQQPGVAHLGLIVHEVDRRQGIATRVLTSLAELSRERGLAAYASTEATNVGARRAIERAGMRSRHRLFQVEAGPR